MLPKWSYDQETMWCQRPRCRTGLEDQRQIHLPVSFCAFVRQAYVPVSTGWRMSEGNKMVQFLLRGNSNKTTQLTQTPYIQPQHTICCHRALEYYTWAHNHRFTVSPHQSLQPCHWPQTNPLALENSSFCLTYCQCEYDSYSHLQANILLAWLWYRLSIMCTFYVCPTCYREWWVLSKSLHKGLNKVLFFPLTCYQIKSSGSSPNHNTKNLHLWTSTSFCM